MANWLRHLTPKQAILYLVLVMLGVALSILLGRPKPADYPGGWDFQAIWLGPYLLAHGESPYDSAAWLGMHEKYPFAPKNDTFLYPLPFAAILLPLGWLPVYPAAVVWAAITLIAIFASIGLILAGVVKWPVSYLLPVIAGIVFFRPVAVNLYILQVDGIVLLWVAAAFYLWRRGGWFWGGVALALTALKPQVGVPMLAFLGIWQIAQRKWPAILGESVGLLFLLVVGILFDPGWVQRWLSIGGSKTEQNFFSTPTLWGMTSLVCKPNLACVQWLGGILAISLALVTLWLILRKTAQDMPFVLGMAICATLFISPYLWTYSQLLLILPLLLVTVALYRQRQPYLLTASFPLLMALFSFGMVGLAMVIGADMLSALVPLLMGGLLLLVYRKDPALLRSALMRAAG